MAPLVGGPRSGQRARFATTNEGADSRTARSPNLSVDAWVADLESVVDAAGIDDVLAPRHLSGRGDRTRLRGRAIRSAVSRLILYGGFTARALVRQGIDRTARGGVDLRSSAPAGRTRTQRFVASSPRCFFRTEPRSRWRGTTSFSDARPPPRPPRVSTRHEGTSMSSSSHRRSRSGRWWYTHETIAWCRSMRDDRLVP